MPLPPTNRPLTVKEFDTVKTGLCGWCASSCGYLLYVKEGKVVDLYGHPADPNGLGSFCTKGIAYIQGLSENPLRLREFLLKEGDGFRKAGEQEVLSLLREALKGKVAVFLDRFSDLKEYLLFREWGCELFSENLFLPFRWATLPPQEWPDRKVIVVLEAEPTFSEVMLSRWLVDASEKGAYILNLTSRYTTVSQKASRVILEKPDGLVRKFLTMAEGSFLEDLLSSFGRETLLLVGDTLLKSPLRGAVLWALRELRKKYLVDYALLGGITPFPVLGLKEFKERYREYDTLVLFGNPLLYFSDEELEELKEKTLISVSFFPNITALHSDIIIPRRGLAEREFINRGVGFLSFSPPTVPSELPDHIDLFRRVLGKTPNPQDYLRTFGVDYSRLIEGRALPDLPDIAEAELPAPSLVEEELWLLCDNGLVDEMGHWFEWTHAIERDQYAYVNEKTLKRLGLSDSVNLRGVKLPLKVNNNLADGVLFVPSSYEEFQPYEPGVRVGRLMNRPYFKAEGLSL
ncbi:MAG: dehydrogenase [Aquificae bacterium]|nr:dehydrogenase [Aquificota bacterium]